MKFKWDKKYLYWGITAFLVIVACTIFYLGLSKIDIIFSVIGSLLSVLTPVLYGFIIAYLLSPVATFFEKPCFRRLFYTIQDKKQENFIKAHPDQTPPPKTFPVRKIARGLSVFVTMTLAFSFIIGLFWLVLPQLYLTISGLVTKLPEYTDNITAWISDMLKNFPEAQNYVLDFTENITEQIKGWLSNDLLPQMNDIVGTVSNGVMGAISAALNLLLGFIIAIYFLNSKELFAAQSKKILYSFLSAKNANRIINSTRNIHEKFGSFISGKLIDSLIIGFLFFIVLTIFQMPYALLIAVIMGVTNIVPFFGCFIGAIPSALLMLLVDPLQALYFIIIVVVIQQFDGNVLSPKILGGSTGLSSFWVIFALLVGQGIFGFAGLIIGIPLFAVIYTFTKDKISARLADKNLPTDSNDYRDIEHIDHESNQAIPFTHNTYVKKEKRTIKQKIADKKDKKANKSKEQEK